MSSTFRQSVRDLYHAGFMRLCVPLFFCLFSLSTLFGYSLSFSSPTHEIYSQSPKPEIEANIGRELDARISEFQMSLGIYPAEAVRIYIISDEKEYQRLSLGRGEIVEYSDGFYDGKEGVIRVRSHIHTQENYLNLLMHEYIHWYIEELFTGAPLWFHEGLATYHSRQFGYERYLLYLRESLINPSGDLFRLSHSYPKDKADWNGFYLSSTMAVRYMQEKHGESWQRFWHIVALEYKSGRKANFTRAFTHSYGTTLWDFHTSFTKHSKKQGYLYLIVLINSLILALLPVVMLIAARKRRKRMKLLPDLPHPEEPAPHEETAKDLTQ